MGRATPSVARSGRLTERRRPTIARDGSHATFKAAIDRDDANGFPIATEILPQMRCAAIGHTGSYLQIDRAMGRLFMALAARKAMTPDQRMIAIFLDDPDLVPVDRLRSQACCPVAEGFDVASPLQETILRGGLHARLRYRGPYADMKDAYRWLLGVWLPRSGTKPTRRRSSKPISTIRNRCPRRTS